MPSMSPVPGGNSPLRYLAWLALGSAACLLPLLLNLPIYSDELHWKFAGSRMLIDEKLVYFFPACDKGFLLDMPWSWLPLRFIDALLYQDLSDANRLRYGGILTFGALLVAICVLLWRTLYRDTALAQILGIACAAVTIGAMPFLMVFNRPEQGVLLSLFAGTGVAAAASSAGYRPRSWQTWGLALLFVLLCWIAVTAHVKAIFLLPAMLIAAAIAVRRWLPMIAVVGGGGFAAFETFRIWRARTDCPESAFLGSILRNFSLSPADLQEGTRPFLRKVQINFESIPAYWDNVSFRPDYHSSWLPGSGVPVTFPEQMINTSVPAFIALGLACVALATAIEAVRFLRKRAIRAETFIGAALVAGLLGLGGYQTTKNFYEASLQAPVLALAVALALPSALRWRAWRPVAVGFGALLLAAAFASHLLLLNRFWGYLDEWRERAQAVRGVGAEVRQLAIRCGVRPDSSSARIMMDDQAYQGLWRTREPLLLNYWVNWWATDLDQDKILRIRKVPAIIAACDAIPERYRVAGISQGRFCCTILSPVP